jgi:hypothetical protein
MIDPKRAIEALRSWFKDRGGTTTPVEIVDAVELGALAIEAMEERNTPHTIPASDCLACNARRAYEAATKDQPHA